MEFKKGDAVEVCDEKEFIKAEYFGFNNHPEVKYPHVVRLYREDGTTEPNIYCYRNCRPDLKKDAPVWVRLLPPPKSLKMAVDKHGYCWMPRHFAGWDNGYMKYWKDGCTSHTVPDENAYHTSLKYRTSPPDISPTAVECYNKVSHL